jgi:hypothetical protein
MVGRRARLQKNPAAGSRNRTGREGAESPLGLEAVKHRRVTQPESPSKPPPGGRIAQRML